MHISYVDAIRSFEGFAPEAGWDYAQITNGFGTRARHAGEVIDRAEADRRFQAEIDKARAVVERHAPRLDEGTKAALTSLTFNAGDTWVKSGLGDAVRRGDLDEVRAIFQQYNKAGGEVLPGLVSRRAAEALWIGNPQFSGGGASATAPAVASAEGAPPGELVAAADPPPVEDKGGAPSSLAAPVFAARVELASISAPGPAPLATGRVAIDGHLSELARLVRLDNGYELLTAHTDREKERARTREV
jgi:lysozyme